MNINELNNRLEIIKDNKLIIEEEIKECVKFLYKALSTLDEEYKINYKEYLPNSAKLIINIEKINF